MEAYHRSLSDYRHQFDGAGVSLERFYTLGYEGATLPDFIHTLKTVGVTLLPDIRELPQSRRPGFSKRVLTEALEDVGIDYRHIRQLGDPKAGRDAARRGDYAAFRNIFGAHLDHADSVEAIAAVADEVQRRTVALMCYERAPKECHRSIVAQRIQALITAEVVHLGVQQVHMAGRPKNAEGTRRLATAR